MGVDGQPWFVGKDVAEPLGYKDIKKAVRMHVEEEDKGGADLSTPGGKQKTVIINESGLYSLIMSSKLPTDQHHGNTVFSVLSPAQLLVLWFLGLQEL